MDRFIVRRTFVIGSFLIVKESLFLLSEVEFLFVTINSMYIPSIFKGIQCQRSFHFELNFCNFFSRAQWIRKRNNFENFVFRVLFRSFFFGGRNISSEYIGVGIFSLPCQITTVRTKQNRIGIVALISRWNAARTVCRRETPCYGNKMLVNAESLIPLSVRLFWHGVCNFHRFLSKREIFEERMKINGDQIFDATMDRWQVKMNCSGYTGGK